jgi:hypothetical protein
MRLARSGLSELRLELAAMTLRTFYRIVVFCNLSMLGICVALDLFFIVFRYDSVRAVETWPNFFWFPFSLIAGLCGGGAIVLWLGMLWDCAFTSGKPVWSKVLWLALLIPMSALGALIYYFCVYTNGPQRKALVQGEQMQV